MRDYIIREDTYMALTGDITDCTIEEFIARLRDKLSKLTSADVISRQEVLAYVDKVFDSGLGKKKSLEFIKKYIKFMPSAEVSQAVVNDSQGLVKQLESLESEYNAYHLDKNDYWRGVKHAIEVLKFRQS